MKNNTARRRCKNERTSAKRAAGASGSTPTAALGALLGIASLHNNIGVQIGEVSHRIRDAPGVKTIKKDEPTEI